MATASSSSRDGSEMAPQTAETSGARVAVALAFVLMTESCIASTSGVFGNDFLDAAERHPSFLSIHKTTFWIIGAIYSLHLVFVVAQFVASEDMEKVLLQRCPVSGLTVRWRIALTFVLRALWWPACSLLLVHFALLIDLVCLALILSTYMALRSQMDAPLCRCLAYAAPVAAHASWMVITTTGDVFSVAHLLGWQSEHGIGGSEHAALLVIVALAALASFVAVFKKDFPWALITAWFLRGVWLIQGPTVLGDVAHICAIGVYMVSCVGLSMIFLHWSAQAAPGQLLSQDDMENQLSE